MFWVPPRATPPCVKLALMRRRHRLYRLLGFRRHHRRNRRLYHLLDLRRHHRRMKTPSVQRRRLERHRYHTKLPAK